MLKEEHEVKNAGSHWESNPVPLTSATSALTSIHRGLRGADGCYSSVVRAMMFEVSGPGFNIFHFSLSALLIRI